MNNDVVLQAEHSLAGCLLVGGSQAVSAIRGICSAGDFISDSARAVFTAAAALDSDGKPMDPVIIQSEAAKRGFCLNNEYLASCMQMCATIENTAEIARIIREAAVERRARAIGMALSQDEISYVAALGQLQGLIRENGNRVLSPLDAAISVMDSLSATADGKTRMFLSTGFAALDEQLGGGLVTGGMITVAARPGTGKTTFALNVADNVAAAGHSVLYVSLEMPLEQLWACRLARATGISRSRIQNGSALSDEDFRRLSIAAQQLGNMAFRVLDRPSSAEDIEREARCIQGLDLVVIDHLGLVKPSQRGSRYELMTDASHRIKQLALSMKIPFLVLCQLNRQSESRESRRPTMADLRDSGAIEEDSDVVGLLFRPAMYAPEDERPKPWESQELDVIVDKNRHSATGGLTMSYCGMTARIQ